MSIINRKIENKSIIWFQKSNSYAIFENLISDMIVEIESGSSKDDVYNWVLEEIDIPIKESENLVDQVFNIYEENSKPLHIDPKKNEAVIIPKTFYSKKQYSINETIFLFQFENEYHLTLIHNVFAHLEIKVQKNSHFKYTFFNANDKINFNKNGISIGCWEQNESHVFQGKVSMHILIDIYKTAEKNWMCVFHASAISNGKEAVLFLGDSGNGKSTSLAILNANGFDCIADDFVPIDNNRNVRTYPAAISIKKKSVGVLSGFYPQLKSSKEIHLKKSNKIVRYLAPEKINYDLKLKCKALVFIKYEKDVGFEINSISKSQALQQLVPDSWISPIKENASIFLDWFLKLPCYQLTYSNNQKMIIAVSKVFNDEL